MLRSLALFCSISLVCLATPGTSVADSHTAGEDPALAAIDAFIEKEKVDKSSSGWKTGLTKPPKQTFTEGKNYFWDLETSEGPISIRFMPGLAPMHVTSTIYLTKLGFYDGTIFHRVLPGFMAQGGDPLGVGTGGPGYKYDGEFDPAVRHDRPGLLSMANTGRPTSDGSQFFLTFVPTANLDGKHTIFGEIVSGMETLKKLEEHGGATSRGVPTKKLELRKATVRVE